MNQLITLPMVLPLLGAGLCLVFGRSARAQRIISFTVLASVVGIAAVLLVQADRYGPQVVRIGGWPAELGISLVADRMSALLLLVSAIVTFCVLVYSLGQGIAEYGRDTPLSVFHPTFLVLCAGVSNAFLSGDLFNLFVGFEVLLVSSYVLITLGGTGARVRAGTTYIIVSLLSSALFLAAIAGFYAAAGTVNMADLAVKLQDIPADVRLVLQLMLLVAFCIKAAVFPLSAWLPDSYPTAPAPVTAVFAGLLTKVGIYAIIRTQTLLFPESELNSLLLWAALLTMIIGIFGAIAQSDIKRMLSFTLVSHIGYMLFGLAIGSQLGLSGALYYTVHHITIQTTLFLVAGLIELRSGTTSLDELGGLARAAPILSMMFFVPAMNLAGIPPFSGFLGKVALVQSGFEQPGWLSYLVAGGAIATSLLTLYAIAKAWNMAFWQPAPTDDFDNGSGIMGALHGHEAKRDLTDRDVHPISPWQEVSLFAAEQRLPLGMAAPTILLVAVGLALTAAAGPLFSLTARAALELQLRAPYIDAVLGSVS